MQIDRVAPVLHSVAQVRNWVVENIPLTESLLGYDLFLKLGNDIATGRVLDVNTLITSLPHPPELVIAHLRQMALAGLLVFEGVGEQRVFRPTPRFLSLLEDYGRKFESLFIVREDLRSQQLLLAGSDQELANFGKLVYDRMYDLGWLYLHNFGSVCFLMASLVRRIAVAHGYAAQIASCHVEITHPQGRYRLGAQGVAQAGQIDGHAACVINESTIVDFGLGNVRKGYRRDFYWGVVCDYRRDGAAIGSVAIPGPQTATWMDDWQSPATATEVERYAAFVENLFEQYAARFL
jgi:hypothetical protein